MNLVSYLIKGPSFSEGLYLHENHSKDILKIVPGPNYHLKSKPCYEGRVSIFSPDLDEFHRIDDIVLVKSLSNSTVQKTEELWDKLNKQCFMLVAINTTIASCLIFYNAPFISIPHFCLATSLAMATIWCLVRMRQAEEEANAWLVRPLDKWTHLRRNCPKDFNYIRTSDLQGKLFTSMEVQNIFVRCLVSSTQNADVSSRNISSFFFNNVITKDNISYAFPGNSIISDPFNEIRESWTKEELIDIAEQLETLAAKYTQIRGIAWNQLSESYAFAQAISINLYEGCHEIVLDADNRLLAEVVLPLKNLLSRV